MPIAAQLSGAKVLTAALALLVFGGLSTKSNAESRFSTILGHDQLPISVVESGKLKGPSILFIHGYSQSYLTWSKQFADPRLNSRFHLIAFDLRGHGSSGKPTDVDAYAPAAWADDIEAIIANKCKDRPILVSWSMGGWITIKYLQLKGSASIAGLNIVGSALTDLVVFPAEDPRSANITRISQMMRSDNIQQNILGTSQFVDVLTAVPISSSQKTEVLAYNMMTPAYVRRALSNWAWRGMPSPDQVRSLLAVPVLISHGTLDAVAPFVNAQRTKAAIPSATLSVYQGAGHSPFWEDTSRFDRELAAFAVSLGNKQR